MLYVKKKYSHDMCEYTIVCVYIYTLTLFIQLYLYLIQNRLSLKVSNYLFTSYVLSFPLPFL